MSCPYEVNDGAYILGALAPAERAEFENHLAACPSCRESVGALAVLPGLLGRLDPAAVTVSVTAPPELLPRVLSAARARRRSQRRRQLLVTAAAGVAAAALATAVGVGAPLFVHQPETAVIVEQFEFTDMYSAEGYSPVDAAIGLRTDAAGTVVAVRCLYHGQDPAQSSWPIWLVVYPRDETGAEAIGSWVATPGAEVSYTGVTHFTPAQIQRIELQREDHTAIAWWTP